MKKLYSIPFLLLLLFFSSGLQAQRYLSEIFPNVTVSSNIEYGKNITVITGSPTMDTLRMDVYQPTGDTLSARPLIIVAHTGSFLPVPQNGQATGTKKDSVIVDLCTRFAKRGFVVASITYRKGWNPVSSVQEVRTGTLLNAAYRGVQDMRTAVRYFRKDAAVGGNVYAIDSTKIVAGGLGTGGYISFGAASLDRYAEVSLAKFINPATTTSYVDTSLSGDWNGMNARPLNIENHPGYSSTIQMAFNLGGAIGDSTWLEAGDAPMVGFHCPSDPFAPYTYGAVIVPTTGDFVVNVSGTHDVIRRANMLGNNAVFTNAIFSDPFTTRANMVNNGYEGLFPFYRPTMESAPWEWWDSIYWNQVPHPTQGTFHLAGLMTNPDMSDVKSRTYIDSVMGYVSPRIVCALGLAGCVTVNRNGELSENRIQLYPNPAGSYFMIESLEPIQQIVITDISGKAMYSQKESGSKNVRMDCG